MKLVNLWPTRKHDTGLDAIIDRIKPLVADCQIAIVSYLGRISNKYGRLANTEKGSRKSARGVVQMLQWYFFETEKVKTLRGKIRSTKDCVHVAFLQAQVSVILHQISISNMAFELTCIASISLGQELNHAMVLQRITMLSEMETRAEIDLNARLGYITTQLMDQNKKTDNILLNT